MILIKRKPEEPFIGQNTQPVRNLLLNIGYLGTDFEGWQSQPSGKTIQDNIEKAIFKLTGEQLRVQSAGRTDAGVHAIGQQANFRTHSNLDLYKIKLGLNTYLPKQIKLNSVKEVDFNFHAQRDSESKIYEYHIYNRHSPSPHFENITWWVKQKLNVKVMNDAAFMLQGEHDFEAFRASDCDAAHAIRNITQIKVLHHQGIHFLEQENGNMSLIKIKIQGNAFCRNMCRIIVGTLVAIGSGKKEKTIIANALKTKKRSLLGQTAPAQGLFLKKVLYPTPL